MILIASPTLTLYNLYREYCKFPLHQISFQNNICLLNNFINDVIFQFSLNVYVKYNKSKTISVIHHVIMNPFSENLIAVIVANTLL
jgi:hypothetical protein